MERSKKETFMRAAIRLSRAGLRKNQGGPFGAVIVRQGKIVGRGGNCVTSTNDPTAHAEIVAIRAAGKKLRTFRLDECEIFTSCEPCPMCLAAIYWAGLTKVYYANTRADAAAVRFRDRWLYQELAKPMSRRKIPMEPLLRAEAHTVFAEWQTKSDKIEY